MDTFAKECAGCNRCVRECEFLSKNGNPGQISKEVLSGMCREEIGFQCSLCGLCAAVCPKGLDPSRVFLEMRQSVFSQKGEVLGGHRGIIAYEKRGLSKRFTLYKIPQDCSVVFFPGCALAGTRSGRTEQIYEWLKTMDPKMGLVLDCCAKPSHDLGRKAFFRSNFTAMADFLADHGVEKVITGCPNCHWVFETYAEKLEIQSIYDLLAEKGSPVKERLSGNVTVHDPCVTRFNPQMHESVRQLVRNTGLELMEMPHSREKTLCCGEGGTVFAVNQYLATNWGLLRKEEASGRKIISYCAGCSEFLGKNMDTCHLLDLVFEPEKTIQGEVKKSCSPFTYLSRIRLKNRLSKANKAEVIEKTSFGETTGINFSQVFVILIIAAGILGARMAGVDEVISQEHIRDFVQGFGPMAPLVFIGIVTLAPAFFLPGAPFIIAGGLIFGPVWGVVYGITGATAGACLAFLVARYAASDWVASKVTHPSFVKIKNQTERHGWKIVAFTRLVPLFPFNLLSYALGLTKIRFLTYFFTSFICMLPGCVGYILLSSSFFDLLQGKFSPAFFGGIGIIVVLSLMPALLKKFKPDNL